MTSVRLYLAQRATAVLMVPLIAVHLAVIFYATRKGLSAEDILSRTRGSVAWALFYATFVVAASIHAGIGIRTVVLEWFRGSASSANRFSAIVAALLMIAGFRAVAAVVLR